MKIITASIELTHKCNFRCIHCSVDAGKRFENELAFNEIKTILKQLKKLKVKCLELTGGEPLLRKDLYKIIKCAKAFKFRIKILTNGSLLSKATIRNLEKVGLSELAISLDGINYRIHKKIRPITRRVHNRVVKNIKIASSSRLFTKINTVIMKRNFEDIKNIIDFAEEFNIDELRFCYFTPVGRGKNLKECVEPKIWLKFVKDLKSKVKVYTGFSHASFKAGCLIKSKVPLTISSRGDIFLCPLLSPIGNIRKNNLVTTIKNLKEHDIKSCLTKNNNICPLRKFDISNF